MPWKEKKNYDDFLRTLHMVSEKHLHTGPE
jgi:hypothetical protein